MVSRLRLPFTDQQLITLHKKDMSDREIAGKLGVPKYTIRYHRRRLGLVRMRLFTDQQLIALHKQGLRDKEIGEALGVSNGIVFKHRRRLGLKAHSRRLFTDQQLIELYEQGLNDVEIGKKLVANSVTVHIHRRRLGLKAHGGARARSLLRRLLDWIERNIIEPLRRSYGN